jgi:hypothetical protein
VRFNPPNTAQEAWLLKQFYFAICSLLIGSKPYILRLIVQRDDSDDLIDHYFEYGAASGESLALDDSLWSTDPETLLDHMPRAAQFHASMDIRQFLRSDYEDALDGSLMAEDYEVVLRHARPDRMPAFA